MVMHQIPDGVRAISLARYLARAYPMAPGWALREALKKRDVRVNGVRAGTETQVSGGDALILYLQDKYLSGPLPTLYEGEGMLAVDKPAGLPMDVDADGVGADTVLTRARAVYPTARLCHRLDAGTGGVALLALEDRAEAELMRAFKEHAVNKTYLCVVRGCPRAEADTLKDLLIKDARDARVRVGAGPGARNAELSYRVARRAGDSSLLEVALKTGRTHQIRVQLAHAGHPLLGDDKYGDRAFNQAHGAVLPFLWCARLEYAGKAFESRPIWAKWGE